MVGTKASDPPAAVNICKEVSIGEEMVINYTYTDLGRQMMILDLQTTLLNVLDVNVIDVTRI